MTVILGVGGGGATGINVSKYTKVQVEDLADAPLSYIVGDVQRLCGV